MATSFAEGVGALVLGVVLLSFYRIYAKDFLRDWALSWFGLAVYHVAGAAALAMHSAYDAAHPYRLTLSILSSVAGYLQLGWLVFGCFELSARRPVKRRVSRKILPALALTGVILALLFTFDSAAGEIRFAVRVGARSLTAGVALLIAAYLVMRARAGRKGIGFLLLATLFGTYGIGQLHYFGVVVAFLTQGMLPSYVSYLLYLDFIMEGLIGLGMITCLLEDEREAAVLANYEIEHLAYHDALTGLPNRPLFVDRLILAIAQAVRHEHKLGIFFLDIDRFKEINDSLGHSVGDSLLKAVAERIKRCVRAEDTVARFGGDEFVIMTPRVTNIEDAAKIAQKILETMKIPFVLGERELFVTASIGISFYPHDGDEVESLVRNADTAMYRAKEQGRDNYQIYAATMNAQALERLALENTLRKAINHDELTVFYQPLIDLRTGSIAGMEALVRWRHPELGLLLPAHFISAAEVSGLIIPMGDWVLRTACKQARAWQRKIAPHLYVAVNLSARQFQQADLVGKVRAALEETGLPPASLILEITESNAMQNAENSIHTLLELKRLGVGISMDDFGTGYSSLNYLKRFPIDTLKLDQSFVQGVTTDSTDGAIATAVISMAHSLRLKVVAEGVETDGQLAFLKARLCDSVQGFLFSTPLPEDEFERFLIGKTPGS